MAAYKCKMCGGDLLIEAGVSVCECEYCGTKQTVPNADNEKKMTMFARAGKLLRECDFDRAAGVFESIVADFSEEAEAYWGLVLCRFGIEYVDDPATGKKVPTCHRSSFDSVMDDSNYELAMDFADTVARRVYREEAKAIEELRKGIIEVSGKEEPYDVFISYKETDDNGERTLDSVIAQDIYDALTDKGYRVFFSRISLEDKLGTEYEPYIFAALNSAKVMLVVGTDYEHFNAVWVKNEWSRFLKLMAADRSKTLIPCYKGIDAYDMPKEFNKLTAQDMGKIGAMQDLVRGVGKIVNTKEKTVVETQSEKSFTEMMDLINRKQAQYDAAVAAVKCAKKEKDYLAAAEQFAGVLDFKDAAKLQKQSLEEAEKAKAEEKLALLKAKKVKKVAKIVVPILIVVIVAVALLVFVVVPTIEAKKNIETISASPVGAIVSYGEYEQDNNTSNGKEDVKWVILDKQEDKVLLISEYIIEPLPFDADDISSVSWKTSDVRQWLRYDFIEEAFSDQEQKYLLTTTVFGDVNPKRPKDPVAVTEDQVFLLSLEEVNRYMPSEESRLCYATDHAIANGSFVFQKEGDSRSWWWLRTVGEENIYGKYMMYVGLRGNIDDKGLLCSSDSLGVRPAMWIDLSD